jgi:hypothetical protein
MTPEEIILRGTDISDRYLKDNPQYKIIRYNENVYAVNLDKNRDATDFIHLWKSHKGNNPAKESELGHGVQGTVYAKTEDKVKKTPLYRGRMPSRRSKVNPEELIQKTSDTNSKILDQQFALKQNGLNSIFTFGLHSIKNLPDKPMFFMPKVASYKPRRKELARMQIDLILQLKMVNEMGFAHDDYCGTIGVKHSSFQNEMVTRDGITLIDMDNGLVEINAMKKPMHGQQARFRDQWLLAYLNKKNTEALPVLDYWYETHNYEPISESPEEILKIVKDLPPKIMDSITHQIAQRISIASQSSLVTQSSESGPSHAEEFAIATVLQPSVEDIFRREQQLAASSIPDAAPAEELSMLSDPSVDDIEHSEPQAEASSRPGVASEEELSTDPQSLSESSVAESEIGEDRAASSSGPRPESVEKLKTIRNMVVSRHDFFWTRKHNLDDRKDETPKNSSDTPRKGK